MSNSSISPASRNEAIKPAPYSAKAANGKLTLKVPAKAVIVVAAEA